MTYRFGTIKYGNLTMSYTLYLICWYKMIGQYEKLKATVVPLSRDVDNRSWRPAKLWAYVTLDFQEPYTNSYRSFFYLSLVL